MAGTAAVLGGGVLRPAAATAASGVDARSVAALNTGRTPTQWGMALPGIVTRFAATGRQLALTFDACDHACDDALLSTLQRHDAPAVLFVCSKWIDANPGRTEQLAANPLFEIGNHGTRHVPLSVTGRLAHMNHPASGTSAGVATAIPALSAAGWEFVGLAGQSVQ